MNVFRDNFGFKKAILLHVFQKMILQKSNKYSSIYETSLKLFEVFVETIKNETDDDQRASNELQAIFEFVINITSERKSGEELETTVKVSIDILTIIFIHICVTQHKITDGEQNPLLNKLLKLNSFKLIMNLIQIDNLHIREHSIKILQLLIFVSP
jgi:hypothetical protein